MQVELSFPLAPAKGDPFGWRFATQVEPPEYSADHQGQVEVGRSDDALIASLREDDGHQSWTNEWIILDRVTI